MTGAAGLLAFAGLVGAAAWAIVRRRARGALEALHDTAAWSAAIAVACAFALTPLRALTAPGMLALAAAAAAVAWTSVARPAPPASAGPGTAPDRLPLLVAATIAAFVGLSLQTAWRAPEAGHDNLAYHLPRIGYWIEQRAVAPFVAGNMRAGSLPPDGEVLALVPALFLGHDRACGLVQLAAAVLTSAAIAVTARRLGTSTLAAALAGLCWLAVPSVLDQALWTLNDVLVSFFLAAAAAFLVRRDTYGHVGALVAAALATFTKTHVAAFTAPLAVHVLWRIARDRSRARTLVAILGPPAVLLLGGLFHLQNLRVWGDPAGLASNRWLVVHPSAASFVKNAAFAFGSLARVFTGDGGLVRRVWLAACEPGFGLFWLAPAIVSVAMLAWAVLRTRPHDREALRPWLGFAAWALGGGAVACAMLRHQPSQVRYLLPAGALLTVTFAWAFDRVVRRSWMRAAATALACAGSGLVMWHWVVFERALRAQPRYRELQPLADAVARLPAGARIGVLAGAYFPESLFFEAYRFRVVPLSYDPPRTKEAFDVHHLDALWVETLGACGTTVFRRTFAPPASEADRSWRASAGYDADFTRAYDAAVEWVDARPTLLAAAAAGWTVRWRSDRGAWLVREGGEPIDPAAICAR